MDMGLDQVKPGQTAVVTDIKVEEALSARLRDMGFVPGTGVCCRYRGPGGRVSAVGFRGTVVAMRTKDLRGIRVRR